MIIWFMASVVRAADWACGEGWDYFTGDLNLLTGEFVGHFVGFIIPVDFLMGDTGDHLMSFSERMSFLRSRDFDLVI